jgi:dihydroorotase
LIKCDPAIKTEIDRAGLFQGLMDGRLDTISSGHVFCKHDQKQGNYFDVVSGIPTSQFTLLSLLEHYHDGILTLQNLIQKASHSVADTFKIKDRGYIREGYWADLVVVDLDKGSSVKKEDIISKAGWSLYEDSEFRSSIYATIVNGNLVYINNKVRSGTNGKRVKFDR